MTNPKPKVWQTCFWNNDERGRLEMIEIGALHALERENELWQKNCGHMNDVCDQLKRERDELKAENERLRTALREMLECHVRTKANIAIAKAALENRTRG